MRYAAVVLAGVLLAACGERAETPLASGAVKTEGPRPSGAVRFCHADYFTQYTRLETLVDGADLIVTGLVTDVRSTRETYGEVRRITLRATWTRKTSSAPATVTIVESPCPALDLLVGDEVTTFLQPFWSDSTPRAAGLYAPLGGPQSVFVARNGTIASPDSRDEAKVVAAYAGRRTADLQADVSRLRPADGDARALFQRHGWRVLDTFTIQELTIPFDFEAPGRAYFDAPFATYSTASAAIGLDLRTFARKDAELLQLTLERERTDRGPTPPIGQAIIVDRQVVGAWVTVYPQRDVFALSARDAALAAPPGVAPSRTPTPNRFPNGVNLARAYQLATADSVKLLRNDGRSVATTVAEVATTLDVLLPTVPAVPAGRGQWMAIFSYGRAIEPFEYDVTSNTLTHSLDGFAVQAPQRFRLLIATVP